MPYLHESTSIPGLTITEHKAINHHGGLLVVPGEDDTLIARTVFIEPTIIPDHFGSSFHMPTLEEIVDITGYEPKPDTQFQICDHLSDLETTTRRIYERLVRLFGAGASFLCTLADNPSGQILLREHRALVAVAQGISAATGHTLEVTAKEDEPALRTGFYL